MQYTSSTNTDMNKAQFGTKGADVLALQKQLNTLGAGLKEDSMYGPLTQAAYEKYKGQLVSTPSAGTTTNTTQNPTLTLNLPTLGDSYANDTSYQNAKSILEKNASGTDIVDTSKIRSDIASQYQDRINAINQIYAEQKAKAIQEGQGRIGSGTAILANRGLAGSMRGGAIAQSVLDQNKKIEDAIDAEKSAAINAIYTQVNSDAVAEAQRRREALTSGATNYIAYLKGQEQTKTDNVNKIAAALVTQGIDISTLSPQDYSLIDESAKKIGATRNDILSAYETAKKAAQVEAAKLQQDINKGLPASAQEYEYAKKNGYTGTYTQYQNEDANRKKAIARAGGGSILTPYQQFQATQSIAKDTQKRTESAREMVRQANLIQSSYQNIVNGKDRSLNTQAIITSFNKILDPTSVVRESEYDRTAQGQALISRLEGKVDNILKGGAGVTKETLQEAANIAKQYLEGANASIQAQNQRARDIATQYGINPDFVASAAPQTQTQPKPQQMTVNGKIYTLQADGTYK